MIYWFIGQCGCGKTTLAKLLTQTLVEKNTPTIHLDGDDLRVIFGNKYDSAHFSKEYRTENTRQLQQLVLYLEKQGVNVVVSTVNPYREVRDSFKETHSQIVEIYVIKSDIRGREHFNANDFEPPVSKYVAVDTTGKVPIESMNELLTKLK